MPSYTKRIKTDIDGKPNPQYFNIDNDDYEPNEGLAGGASSHILGSIVQDAWSGSSDITKNLTKPCIGLSLKNDGATDVTITINAFTIIVKAGESFNANFEKFTTLTITTTSSYRALVLR